MIFFTIENPYSKLFFQLSTDFQSFCSTYKDNLSAKKIACLYLNEIEDIREIPLSESRNYREFLYKKINSA